MWHTAVIVTLAVIAELVQLHQSKAQSQGILQFRGGAKHPKSPVPSSIISQKELEEYHRDGFILKKGLLQGEELSQLMEGAEEIYATSNQKDINIPNFFQKLTFDLWRRKDEFAQLAFEDLPSVAAELLGFEQPSNKDSEEEDTIRILKDGFFGFQQKNNSGCGFHVDDAVFWPASYETTGVNFWVALSPMRILEGGGIRVVNQSKVEPIFEECRQVITTPGEHGYPRTCDMEVVSPECHMKMLEASVVFDMEPGDALIWDRWTFHRSEPFRPTPEVDEVSEEECTDPSLLEDTKDAESDYRLRYTIRYVPGTAKASGRHHPSQATGETFDSPFYPQVWPSAVKSEIKSIQNGLDEQ